ncbi:dephospho-CoA kinase, partial [Aquipuribacter hungaricus]
MLRVGLTGGIGAGKSTVARRLAARGAVVVDADQLAREVVAPGSPGLAEVAREFGPGVLAADGSLDRGALGAVVFGDAEARGRLEALTHPRIRALTEERVAAAPDDAVVVHDVPLLVELRYEARYHLTVVVHAGAEERVRRLVDERGSTEEDARRRVAAQADDDARRRAADVWLDNTGAPGAVLAQVDALWDDRLLLFEAGVRARRPAPRDDGLVLSPPDPAWQAAGARLAARV